MNNYKPSILESENPEYVLIHKRVFTANCTALAIAVEKLAEAFGVSPEYISEIMTEMALQRAKKASRKEIEKFVQEAIKKNNRGTLIIYK